MNEESAAETLKKIVMEKELPGTEFALFGVRCPYCGKMDRIRPLEPPGEIDESLLGEERTRYEQIWRLLVKEDQYLGVCWFCRNVLLLGDDMSKAKAILP